MHGCFLLSVLEGMYMVSFVGSFDGSSYDMGGPFICILLVGIMTAYDIDYIQFNDFSSVSCK